MLGRLKITLEKNRLMHYRFSLNCCQIVFLSKALSISPQKLLIEFLQSVVFDKIQGQIVQLSVSCDIILDPKLMKFL